MPKDALLKITRRVSLDDVFEFCRSDTSVPSSFGPSLERARDGAGGAPDPVAQRTALEVRMLYDAALIGCVDGLERYKSVKFVDVLGLRKIARKVHMGDGALVVGIIRAYAAWDTLSRERGLAEVYTYLKRIDSSLPEAVHDEENVAQAFRVGKALTARTRASRALADAMLALAAWVELWNKRGAKNGTAA